MKKRIVSLLMAVLMTVSLLPTAAWAEVLEAEASQELAAEEPVEPETEAQEETETAPEEAAPVEEETTPDVQLYAAADTPAVRSTTNSGTCGTNLTWTLDSAGTLTISGTGEMGNYYYDESKTPWSDCPWHDYRSAVRKVIIEDGVTSIGSDAFTFNYNMESVSIPGSVTSIGDSAFFGCYGLTSVTIPEGVTRIGDGAFYACSKLAFISLPVSLQAIGYDALYAVKDWEEESQYYGSKLTDIYYGGSSMRWVAIGGNDAGVPESATIHYAKESDSISGRCGEKLTWTLDSAGTLTVSGTGAMWDRWDEEHEMPNWSNYTINKLVIDDGVTSIGACAFQDCSSLTEAVIAGTVTEIGRLAFVDCTALKEVTISGANVSVIANAFYGCDSLTTINYGGTMAQWKAGAGAAVALPLCASVNCTNGTITPQLSGSCGTNVSYRISPDGVLTVSGTGAMADYTYTDKDTSDCPWHSVRFAIKKIVIEDGITRIGNYAFKFDANVTSVTIPDSVTSIGRESFYGCDYLTEISIPGGVTSIGANALDCAELTSITFGDTEARWRNIGGGKAGVPESTTITYSALDTALEKAGFTAPGTIFTDGGAEYDVSFPNYYNETDNPGGILPDVYFDGFKDVSIGELTLTLHDDTAEAWRDAYIQSAGWLGISDRVMCTIPYYAPAGATQYAAYIGTDVNAALAFATSGGQRYSNDGGCLMGTPIAEVDTSNGRMTNVDDYTTYYLVVWYNAAGAPIARHALRIHVTSEAFNYALSVDDLLRGAGYAVPTTSQFYIDVPAGLEEGTDYTIAYDQTTGHATVKLLPGNEAHWQQAFESLLEIVVGFEKPQPSATRLSVYFGDRDDSWVGPYIGDTYGDYYGWYTGDNLRPGSGRTFASVSEDADSNVTISVPQGSSWVRCIAVWADSSGNVLDKFMYTLSIEADSAFSYTWNAKEAEETVVASGKCGDNLTWTLDSAGLLTISGTGAMDNYYYDEDRTPWSDCPWHKYRSAVRKVIIEDGVTFVGNEAFTFNYNIESVSIPGSVTSIGYSAFYGCYGLTDVTIPEGVTSIGEYAFYACSRLESISLPASLKEVGDNALYAVKDWEEESQYYGTKLTDIYYGGSSIRWAAIGGDDASVPEGVTIHYAVESDSVSGQCGDNLTWTLDSAGLLTISGTGAMTNYYYDEDRTPWSDCPWHEYRSAVRKVIIEDGVTSIGSDAFIFNCYMESVSIPNSVTSIGFRAFSCCYGLTDVTIPEGVTSIGGYAFYACSRLESISLPASLEEVGDSALYAVKDWEEESQYYGTKLTDIYYTSSEEQWESIKNIGNAGIPTRVTVTYILRGVLSSGDEKKPSVLDMQNLYTYLTTDKIEGGLYAENEKAYQLAADLNGDENVDVYDLQYLYEVVSQG